MSQIRRVRRALLFMPGDSQRKIAKGAALGADSIIMDLEDGVAMTQKDEARQTTVQALRTLDFGRSERLIRVNPIGSGLTRDDFAATLPARPDGYVLPKVESAEHIRLASAEIDTAEQQENWTAGAIRLLAIVETARGIVNLREIAACAEEPGSRLDALLFGAEDLAGSIGAVRTREGWEVFYGRSAVVIHAAAYNLQAIDTIYADIGDTAGLAAESVQAAQMGFTGKLAIHPAQVEPITAAFTPTDEAITAARRLVQAYEIHQQNGAGVFVLDGRMIDTPMLRAAQNILARAWAAGKIQD